MYQHLVYDMIMTVNDFQVFHIVVFGKNFLDLFLTLNRYMSSTSVCRESIFYSQFCILFLPMNACLV